MFGTLQSLEYDVDKRIKNLEDWNVFIEDAASSIKSYLEQKKTQNSVDVDASCPGAPSPRQGSQEEPPSAPNKLDDILAKARNIRIEADKAVVVKSSKEQLRKNSKKEADDDSGSASTNKISKSKLSVRSSNSPVQKEAIGAEFADIIVGVDGKLQKLHHKHPGNVCISDKSLYLAQAQVLTNVKGRPSFPPSVLNAVVEDSLLANSLVTSPVLPSLGSLPVDEAEEASHFISFQMKTLTVLIKKHRVEYERVLQSRLSRLTVFQLTEQDKQDVLFHWLRIQRYVNKYEQLMSLSDELSRKNDKDVVSSSGDSRESGARKVSVTIPLGVHTPQLSSFQTNLSRYVFPLPLSTPFSSSFQISFGDIKQHSKRDPVHFSNAISLWKQNRLSDVAIFHKRFKARMKYCVESEISKIYVKAELAILKKLCQSETESLPGKDQIQSENERYGSWSHALKIYALIHSCLTFDEPKGFGFDSGRKRDKLIFVAKK